MYLNYSNFQGSSAGCSHMSIVLPKRMVKTKVTEAEVSSPLHHVYLSISINSNILCTVYRPTPRCPVSQAELLHENTIHLYVFVMFVDVSISICKFLKEIFKTGIAALSSASGSFSPSPSFSPLLPHCNHHSIVYLCHFYQEVKGGLFSVS